MPIQPVPPRSQVPPASSSQLPPQQPPRRVVANDPAPRLVSLDAYRGFTMLLMVSSGLGIPAVAAKFPDNQAWQILGYQLDHVPWIGCSIWDLIQPSFMFMVGVAIPYSYSSRIAKGQSPGRIWFHALIRSMILVLLGVFLMSNWSRQTNWTFVNVLTQIGLGYMFVFALRGMGTIIQLLVAILILTGYWAVFVYSGFDVQQRRPIERPVPATNRTEFQRVHAGPAERFDHDPYAAHWTKNMNFASEVDERLLNALRRDEPLRFSLFDREWESYLFCRTDAKGDPEPYILNEGGYATLNFIPSIATMIFGLIAGEWLRRSWSGGAKLALLLVSGVLCLVVGLALDHYIWPDWLLTAMAKLGDSLKMGSEPFFNGYGDGASQWPWTICPTVKRIWTPTWVIFSAGWTFVSLAGFYLVIDLLGWKRWAFPFVVVGLNSIAMYCMAMLLKPWIAETLKRHFGTNIFSYGPFQPLVQNTIILAVLWLVCYSMYRRKIFIRI